MSGECESCWEHCLDCKCKKPGENMNIDHLPDLAREIKVILRSYASQKFPVVIHFKEGMEHPQFVITIEKNEVDTFIDATGQKWKKVK